MVLRPLRRARKRYLADIDTIPLLVVDDLETRKLPPTAAKDLLEIVMRRYERASTLQAARPIVRQGSRAWYRGR